LPEKPKGKKDQGEKTDRQALGGEEALKDAACQKHYQVMPMGNRTRLTVESIRHFQRPFLNVRAYLFLLALGLPKEIAP